jgi:hypothetical protein
MFDPNLTPEEKNKRAVSVENSLFKYDPEGYKLLYGKSQPTPMPMSAQPANRGMMGYLFGKSSPAVSRVLGAGLQPIEKGFEQGGLIGGLATLPMTGPMGVLKGAQQAGTEMFPQSYDPGTEMNIMSEIDNMNAQKKKPIKKNIYQR